MALWKLRLVYFMLTILCLFLHTKTPKLSWSFYMLAPGVVFTNFMFRGIYLVGIVYEKFASCLFELYGTIACMTLTAMLTVSVFNTMQGSVLHLKTQDFILILDALVPLIMFLILIVDLVLCIFTVTTPEVRSATSVTFAAELDYIMGNAPQPGPV